MAGHFDTGAEDAKLAEIREREEEDLAQILSGKYGLRYADLSALPIDNDALRLIPEADARGAETAAFQKAGRKLSVAVRNPQNPALAGVLEELGKRGFIVERFLVSTKSLEKALSRYAELSLAVASSAGIFDIGGDALKTLSAELTTLGALKFFLATALLEKRSSRVSKLLEGMLAGAFALKASDIHVEPEDGKTRLRLRLDGVLTDTLEFDPETYRSLASRVKLLAGLKLNVDNRAQDGRFSVTMQGSEIEIRVSLIPGNYGESIVMRILDPASIQASSFDTLGIHPKLLARLETEITRPNGMLLTTGPTGSGKTTTLYSCLRKLHTPDVKIVTIEDPIEYHLEGIVQTQTEGDKYTFASGLRSILRQDPDIIMVGEIRDAEVAEVAIQAALTGHFVFSTLHTNNAAGTFPRLVDLGIDPKTFASAITVAMAQRLVRKLDPQQRKQAPIEGEQKRLVEKILSTVEDKSLLPASTDTAWVPDPKGPDETGYHGRLGLYEAIFMDTKMGEFVRTNPSESEITREAAHQGYLTMAQDGILKAIAGETSLEEVFRVVDLPRD
ncbi:MAG: GspE/PulE family protein [bacterium]